MSRSNHYRLCYKCTEETRCYFHEEPRIWGKRSFFLAKKILGRRPWHRKARYPRHSIKEFHSPPPRWWWQEQHSRARATYRRLMQRSEDPALPRERDLINLWMWY